MTGSNYDFTVSQLTYHVVIHQDAHMFFMQIEEE